MWWWKVALHLDEAQLALSNAMAHNLDDQRPVFALQDRLREGQAILLEIFRMKGLLPVAPVPMPGMPMPGMPMPGMPMPGVPAPVSADVAVDVAVEVPVEQGQPMAADEAVAPKADQTAVVSEPAEPVVLAPEAAATGPVVLSAPLTTPSANSGAGGVAGR
jgi:hypothetical protein